MLFNELFTPPDNDELREQYVKGLGGKRGGTCGPASIAVLTKTTVKEIIDKWRGIGNSAFRGFSPIREMKETLVAQGYSYKYIRGHKAKTFPSPNTDRAIIRIQWLKEDGTEYYWRAAGAFTHYVYMEKINGIWMFFCNSQGWLFVEASGTDYLEGRGYISSYLELTKREEKK